MARPFAHRGGQLEAGGQPLATLARRWGTPLYVYDFEAVRQALAAFQRAFHGLEHRVCAAVKANANLALLARLARWGAGFDVVSGGELERVLTAGGDPATVVFSGVGKTAAEMDLALRAGILLFQVESEPELELLAERAARLRRRARFGLRINPDVAAATHPHIATGRRQHKFGVSPAEALALYRASRRSGRWLAAEGIGCHIGSQILAAAPFQRAAARLLQLAARLEDEGFRFNYLDLGGGLGIAYAPGQRALTPAAYAAALRPQLARWLAAAPARTLLLEPGRSLVGAAGCLLTRVLYVKRSGGREFAITDAGSNDLMRPALYGAYHEIAPVRPRAGRRRRYDVVGPLCETGDRFAADRLLPPLRAGDLLALLDAGAYGFTLSSNYNVRPRAAEVGLDRGRAQLIRRRETTADLLAPEPRPR
ncbi:MAG: diaminopimelate decarboxylase [Terriglobales bacterium]